MTKIAKAIFVCSIIFISGCATIHPAMSGVISMGMKILSQSVSFI